MSDLFKVILYDLGIDINEEFSIVDNNGVKRNETFRVDKYARVQYKRDDCWFEVNGVISEIILGRYKIVKKPFQPKLAEGYWSYFADDWRVSCVGWCDSANDYVRLKCGVCFRTKEEAIRERPRCYKELTGKEWQGEQNV